MVRPTKGDRNRKTTTITVDPVEYALFQANVEKFLPDPSASQHLGTLIRNENARFAGQEGAGNPIVDEAALERQHKTLAAKHEEIKQILEKRDAYTRATNLMISFGITASNGKEVIAKMLQDQDKPDSRVRKELSNSDFQLLISLIQFGTLRVRQKISWVKYAENSILAHSRVNPNLHMKTRNQRNTNLHVKNPTLKTKNQT